MDAREKRRIGFELPPLVFEELLLSDINGSNFWESLRIYYNLSPVMGDTVICSIDFSEYIERETGSDKPAWVYEQGTLKKMQCMVIAGPTRGHVLLEKLKEIKTEREKEAEAQAKRDGQLEALFQGEEDIEDADNDYEE